MKSPFRLSHLLAYYALTGLLIAGIGAVLRACDGPPLSKTAPYDPTAHPKAHFIFTFHRELGEAKK